jgi:hypothetical protein
MTNNIRGAKRLSGIWRIESAKQKALFGRLVSKKATGSHCSGEKDRN